MQIETQKQLKPFNTLSLNAIASHYVQIHSPDELVDALDYAQQHALNVGKKMGNTSACFK
jgi:UDP-N-acetylmuramate dehydrogenase